MRQLIEEATQAARPSPECTPGDALRARLREHYKRDDDFLRVRGWPLGLALQVPQSVPELREERTPWRDHQRQVLRALCIGELMIRAEILRTETRAPEDEGEEIVNGMRVVNTAAVRASEMRELVGPEGTPVEELIATCASRWSTSPGQVRSLLSDVVHSGRLRVDEGGVVFAAVPVRAAAQ